MNEKILVVDDEEDYMMLMVMHLKRKGYDVFGVANSTEAIELFKQHGDFKAIVTDWMMPVLSGNDLIREAQSVDPLIQAIIITSAGVHLRSLAGIPGWGNFPHLTKPLSSMDVLSDAVQKALDYRQELEKKAAGNS